MELKDRTVCFTGHRELKDRDCEQELYTVIEELVEKGFCFFGCGGARGFDSLAEKVILELKETKYPYIHLILVLPFHNQYEQETRWSGEEIDFYHYAKAKADKLVHLSPVYRRGIYYKRNRYLVDGSSVCVAYQYKNTGGTAYTVKYAQERGLDIVYI